MPATKDNGCAFRPATDCGYGKKTSCRQRVIYRLGDIAFHGLTELRIHLVRDSHHPEEQHTEVNTRQVFLQRVEYADLQYTGLFYHHGGRISLLPSGRSVFGRGNRHWLLRAEGLERPKSIHQISEDGYEMNATKLSAQWDCHQTLVQFDSFKPILDSAGGGTLKNRSHTLHYPEVRGARGKPVLDRVNPRPLHSSASQVFRQPVGEWREPQRSSPGMRSAAL
jgi:hypothetical protein